MFLTCGDNYRQGSCVMVRYRPYRDGDEDGVKELNSSILEEHGFRTGRWDSDLDSIGETYLTGGCFWIAESADDQIIGTAAIRRISSSEAELKRLRVRKDQRRRGIGTRLLDLCISFCRKEGYERLVLDTASAFEDAISLYEGKVVVFDGTKRMDIDEAISSTLRAKWDGRLLLYHLDLFT